MAETRISWADVVWNPVTGCTPVSAGCHHCYAKRMARRLAGRVGYPEGDGFAVTLHPSRLEEPTHSLKPQRIFVCSMGDLFHKDVPEEYIATVFSVMEQMAHHTFLVLTKRAERMAAVLVSWEFPRMLKVKGYLRWPLPNVHLGVSVENQRVADERIPLLLQTPAAVRWVSCEPLLGPVDLMGLRPDSRTVYNALEGCGVTSRSPAQSIPNCWGNRLDWVVAGSETGPGARPCDLDWLRGIRDQTKRAGVPFWLKQVANRPEVGTVLDGERWRQLPEVRT